MMRREDYKAVKRMDKPHMEEYLQKVYRRGFEAGFKAAKSPTPPLVIQKDHLEENKQEGE